MVDEPKTPHAWYGPCDRFGPGGACSECVGATRSETATHRPAFDDPDHTACGLPVQRFPVNVNLHLGEGETCPVCTHVVAQCARAMKRGASNAVSADPELAPAWGVFDTHQRRWCPRRGTEQEMGAHAVKLNGAPLKSTYRYQPLPLPGPSTVDHDAKPLRPSK